MASIFASFLRIIYIAALQKSCQGDFGIFQGSSESRFHRFGGSENDRYFLKIPKRQHKLVRDYEQEKLLSFFLNIAAKTYLYGLKFQRTLKLIMFFSLKLFSISVAISTQVASAPLMIKLSFIKQTF